MQAIDFSAHSRIAGPVRTDEPQQLGGWARWVQELAEWVDGLLWLGSWVRAQTGRGVGIVAAAELLPVSAAHTVCCSSAPAGFASNGRLLLIAVLHWYETHTKKAAMQQQVLTSLMYCVVLCCVLQVPATDIRWHIYISLRRAACSVHLSPSTFCPLVVGFR
jgi:hypothetical protein